MDNVDGGPGAPSDAAGSGETDLDVEQSGSLAPGANVIIYQAPNTDSGFAGAFFDAASQSIASTVFASWLESETYLQAYISGDQESPGYQAAFDEAFLEMGAQGQSSFVASGDQGAYQAIADLGTTNIAVAASADSPYITAAGGTTLPWSASWRAASGVTANVDVKSQRTWGWDYLWQPVATLDGESFATAAETNIGGGGGGYFDDRAAALVPVRRARHRRGPRGPVPDADRLTTVTSVTGSNLVEPTDWSVNPTPSVTPATATGGPSQTCPPTPTRTAATCCTSRPRWPWASPPSRAAGAAPASWRRSSTGRPRSSTPASATGSGSGTRRSTRSRPAGHSPLTPLNAVGTSSDNLYYTGNPGSVSQRRAAGSGSRT